MIVVKTKLTKIPESCGQCKYSRMEGYDLTRGRVCTLLRVYIGKDDHTNKLVKPKSCPLTDVLTLMEEQLNIYLEYEK